MQLNKIFLNSPFILMVSLLVSCGSLDDQITSGIGPTGGTVTSSDGLASVSIPTGALSKETAITIEGVFSSASGNIGNAYEFGPSGTVFKQPVTISITYVEPIFPSGTQELDLKLAELLNNHWQIDPSSSVDTNENIVSGTTTSFSIYSVVDSSTLLNSMPLANAGNDQNVTVGSLVTLDGTNSSDVNGDQITYNWTITTKPTGSLASLSDPASSNPTFTADILGGYVFSLIVNDATANSNPDSITINVTISIATVDSDRFVGENPSIAIGADGLPVISYYDSTNGDLKLVHCGNAVCNSGNTLTTVDSNGLVGESPSIIIGADGLPVISYYDAKNGDLKIAHCGNAACNSGNTLTIVDSNGFVGFNSSIAIGTDGLPVISYVDFTNGDLKIAHCGNAVCNSGNTLTTVDSDGTGGGSHSITIGMDGVPVISYYGLTNGDLKVAHCGNASCSSGNILTTVDSATVGSGGFVGFNSSITIGADNLPVISYVDFINSDLFNLKVVRCGNASCSSGNTLTTVDSYSDVGFSPSIAIGADGLPVISYVDSNKHDLKVAHCGNPSCSSGNTLTTVDSIGIVGVNSSITIGADNLPVISYYDFTKGDLKVGHCGNAQCTF